MNTAVARVLLDRRKDKTCKRCYYVDPTKASPSKRKTILLLGAHKSGKTSLVNAFANYFKDVKEEDSQRFIAIPQPDPLPQLAPYDETVDISTYVFCKDELPTAIAFVDTPALGRRTKGGKRQRTYDVIREWFENEYHDPIVDLEIWFIIPASISTLDERLTNELRDIVASLDEPAIRVTTVVTFAKCRVPLLPLRAVSSIGLKPECANVDYFAFNSAKVLGFPDELVEVNALGYSENMKNMAELLLMTTEPAINMDKFAPSRHSTRKDIIHVLSPANNGGEFSATPISALTPASLSNEKTNGSTTLIHAKNEVMLHAKASVVYLFENMESTSVHDGTKAKPKKVPFSPVSRPASIFEDTVLTSPFIAMNDYVTYV